MMNIGILGIEIVVTSLIVVAGLSEKKILFINGPRSAVITLGVIGILMCMISIGTFISSAPMHPLTVLGYLFGILAMLIFLSQIFGWNIPLIHEPRTVLFLLSGCIILKGVIGRFVYLLPSI